MYGKGGQGKKMKELYIFNVLSNLVNLLSTEFKLSV